MFQAGLFDELESLYPDTPAVGGAAEYQTAAAGGTYAGVHIMLDGLTPGMPVAIRVEGFSADLSLEKAEKESLTLQMKGHPAAWKLFELLALPVEVNSGATDRTEWLDGQFNPHVVRRAPFSVYDVLRPCTNIITPHGVSAALAFRCRVEGRRYGVRPWRLEITHCGVTRALTFSVEEFPVQVPPADKDQHKYVNWIGENIISNFHGEPRYTPRWYRYLKEYFRLAHYGRQNMACLWPDWYFEADGGGTPRLIEERLDRLIETAEQAGIYWFSGGTLTGRKNDDWDASSVTVKFCGKEIPGDGEPVLAEMGRALYGYLEKRGLKDRWMQSFMDEPEKTQAETYRLGVSILKRAMPGVSILEATLCTEPIAGTVDVWCPVTRAFEDNQEFFQERARQGEHVFVYTCLQPAGNYCNRMLDMERIRQVWLGWAPAKYKTIEGFLHWGGCFLSEGVDPYYLPERLGPAWDYSHDRHVVLPAGDSAILYPGFQAVYSTARLEAHRIGLEDLALLQRLQRSEQKETAAETDALIESVFRGYSDYEKDILRYRAARRKLFQLAEAAM